MMAQLWARNIVQGKKTFAQVPRLLKDQVKQILIDSGRGDLAGEDVEEGTEDHDNGGTD